MSTLSPETRQDAGDPRPGATSAPPIDRHVSHPWLIVLTREILVKVRDKAFIFSTLFTLVVIVGMVLFNAFMANRTQDFSIATDSDAGTQLVQTAGAMLSGDDEMTAEQVTRDEARQLVADEEADAAIYQEDGRWVILADSQLDGALDNTLTAAVNEYTMAANAQAAGITPEQLREGAQFEIEYLSGGNDRGFATYIMRFVFAMLFYMSAVIFGMAIANSVLEEKQNRVVEILATAIPIRQLLYGKILGNCILAFAQIALYAGAGLLTANIAGVTGEFGWALEAAGWFIVFFVFGFAAQATIWAVLGSLASRSEDLQSNTTAITMILVAGMFAGILAQGPWLAVASYVPIISSIAMPVRMLEGQAQMWEPFVALAVCLAFGWFMVRLGEKVYQRAVFQGGRSLSWRQALKLEQ
ncbi:ABC transporter permease [Kocuria coralli]|uniref:ABC transporter permease n=1 Tax=Kocuria coralli TaxID=1461025 RepID=A0A5J5L1M0_9MICC|nr:ABC transporter permease [Kocuria coralli]KAA9395723.1 ABC transporter permease [Kocuria coralli]